MEKMGEIGQFILPQTPYTKYYDIYIIYVRYIGQIVNSGQTLLSIVYYNVSADLPLDFSRNTRLFIQ